MKWDRWLAIFFLTAGIGYASYSGVNYILQLQVVEKTENQTHPPSLQTKKGDVEKSEDVLWRTVPTMERPKKGEHFADLVIPRLEAKIPIIEGTNEDELERGVGHYSKSVLPGEPDNAVLSGHRDTVFRQMGNMQLGDELRVVTIRETFVYVIQKMWTTDALDRTVIVPREKPVLTLTTCYPFSYIGPAPERYIIEAHLTKRLTNSD
ncbi:class D sortase [Thermoactinomyces sp. DSM 45892]|uniref:class D sortase n=1 Tax=Thermoactinomyces sp. DSM 45892 TaxID=1882753 RepID=UPI00089D7580|nr:class D sortase [Thermoactinomyces sp. DSM 45892]SDZ28680.1 sortase A [Thermoactinomyces sp. DSM 45892]